MPQYERKEWTRFWCDEAPDTARARVLPIGDSITAQYTGTTNAHLGDFMRADSITTSKGLDHPFYEAEIDLFACEFSFDYRAIHFNNGLHAFQIPPEEYERLLDSKVAWLKERFPAARIALATSTPVLQKGPERVVDPQANGIVLARNEAVKRVAARHSLPVDDLYAASAGHAEWRSEDGYHFNEAGSDALGGFVAAFVRAMCEGKE